MTNCVCDITLTNAWHLKKIVWHTNPDIILKFRKRFFPLGLTKLTLGIDFDIRSKDVAFKWSWKDRLIGGRLQLDRDEISITKRFDVDGKTHLDLRAAYDLHLRRTLFSIRVKPFPGVSSEHSGGLRIKQKVPVDKHIAVEVHARVQLPEAKFSTQSTSAFSLGEGDFIVDLDQLNFRFMLQ